MYLAKKFTLRLFLHLYKETTKMSKKEEAVAVASRLKPEVRELSSKIRQDLDGDKTTGVISVKEGKDPYYDHMPDGLNRETHQKYNDYTTNFVAASADAVGHLGNDLLGKSKSLDTCTAEIKMGKDAVHHTLERRREFTYGAAGDRKETEKFGVMRTAIDIKGGRNSGQLKIARDEVAAAATEKFGSK